jgi:transcriptional regulator with XRE-family HTH domain
MNPKRRQKSSSREGDYARLVAEETLIFDVTEEISRLLDAAGITRKELAEALGKTKGHVTQLLSGERNMTLRTAADLAHALDRRLHVRARPLDGSFERPGQPSHCENPPESFFWAAYRHGAHLDPWQLEHRRSAGADLDPAGSITESDEQAETVVHDHEFTLAA